MEALLETNKSQTRQQTSPDDMISFYEEATMDYEFWSKDLHMHYGFAASPLQIFRLSTMLDQMSKEVGHRLKLQPNQIAMDFGCGMGASLRTLAKKHPHCFFQGINVVDTQIKRAKKENLTLGLQNRIQIIKADYHRVPLPDKIMNGTFAIESYCHAENKNQVLEEMARVLKPGGRLVIADCFLRRKLHELKGLAKYAYRKMNQLWHLPELPEISLTVDKLNKLGFGNIRVENISLHVAPSVLYSPFKVLSFQWKNRKNQLASARKNNVAAVLMASLLGTHIRQVGYFIVHATKT